MVSALLEAWLRKPTYEDLLALRDDTQHAEGLVAQPLRPRVREFLADQPGTAIGVWIGGARSDPQAGLIECRGSA